MAVGFKLDQEGCNESMAITKKYDEMADRWTYVGTQHQVIKDKHGFGEVWLTPQFVDLKDGGDTFWLAVYRKGADWHFLDDTSFILLIDGKRFTGAGIVAYSEVTQEAAWFETKVVCNEDIHCGTDSEIMKQIASSQSAKFRLKDIDFVLPQNFVSEVKEIVVDIDASGGYGAR